MSTIKKYLAVASLMALPGFAFAQGQEEPMGTGAQKNTICAADLSGAQPGADVDTSSITKFEQALSQKNVYESGVRPDGKLDQKDLDAVRKFQSEQGMTVSGCIDQSTIDALGVSIQVQDLAKASGIKHGQ